MKYFDRVVKGMIKHRVALMLVILVCTVFSGIQTIRLLAVDNTLAIWFLDDNPDYKEYIQFQEEQGSDEIIVGKFTVDKALTKQSIQLLNQLHNTLDTLPYVHNTFSLAKAQYPIYTKRGILYKNIYSEKRSKKGVRKLLSQMPVLSQQLLTKDEKDVFFYIQLEPTPEIEAMRSEIIANIQQQVKTIIVDDYSLSGAPVLNEAFNQTVYNETLIFTFFTVAAIILMLFLLLVEPIYVLIALLSVILPVTLVFGIITTFGFKLNIISMLIPTILMVYSVSDAIHVINIYQKHCKQFPDQDRTKQIQLAFRKSLRPCFYTTLTTIIGYIALYLSPLPAFKSMGIFTSIGLVLSFTMVYVITAIGFSYLPKEEPLRKNKWRFLPEVNLDPQLIKLNRFTSRYAGRIVFAGIVLFILGLIAVSRIEINTDSMNLLADGKEKEALHDIEGALNGSARIQLNVFSNEKVSMLTDSTLTRLKAFQERLDVHEHLSSPISIYNVKAFLEKRTPQLFRSTFTGPPIDSLLLKSSDESEPFFSLFSKDLTRLGIALNIREMKSKELEQLLVQIDKDFEETFGTKNYRLKVQGFSAVYSRLNDFILLTQMRSFTTAFFISFLILIAFIKSMRTSIMALIPNLIPLVLLAIGMVALDISLEVSTAMIAPIMLGIAMDDTIHLIYNYQKRKVASGAIEAIDDAVIYTGKALFATSITLGVGFLIIGQSKVESISNFGYLCAFAIFSALIADVLFLPALIKLFYKKKS